MALLASFFTEKKHIFIPPCPQVCFFAQSEEFKAGYALPGWAEAFYAI